MSPIINKKTVRDDRFLNLRSRVSGELDNDEEGYLAVREKAGFGKWTHEDVEPCVRRTIPGAFFVPRRHGRAGRKGARTLRALKKLRGNRAITMSTWQV